MKINIINILATTVLLFGFFSVGRADDDIAVIGRDKAGQQVAVGIPEKDYAEQVFPVFNAIQTSTMNALAKDSVHQGWMLRQVIVGAGLQFDGSLGPIVSVSTKARVRLLYANTTNLFFP